MSDRQDQLEAKLHLLERRSRRQRVTNVVLGVMVLAFGGAGAAYAVTLAPANSVNSAAIIDRTIGTPDVKVGAFAGQTILDNSLTGADVNEATLVPACPSGLTKVGDVCFGSQRAAATFGGAVADCIDERLRLPTISEGRLISLSLNSDTFIWVDSAFKNGDAFGAAIAKSDSYGLTDNAFSNIAYHCVTTVGARP